MGEAQALSHAI